MTSESSWAWVALGAVAAGLGVAALSRTAGAATPARTLPRATVAGVYTFNLRAGAFDSETPSVAVIVPPTFDASRALSVALYFRGFGNCVVNVVAERDGPCRPGGPTHHASHLARQLTSSRANALLVVPELKREQRTGAAGRLGQAGGMEAFLMELLGESMAPHLGRPFSLADVGRVSVMGHSGGYTAMAGVLRGAGGALAPKITDVALLDALYGDSATFARWVAVHAHTLRPLGGGAGGSGSRLVCVYTQGGGTADNAASLARTLRPQVSAECFAWNDQAVGALEGAAEQSVLGVLSQKGVVVQRSSLSHTEVSRAWPRAVWATW